MSKKKVVAKKKIVSKVASNVTVEKNKKGSFSWLWYLLGIVVLLGVLFLIYDGVTGNVITGNASSSTSNAFEPIIDMISGLISNIYEVLKEPLELLVGQTADVSTDSSLAANIFLAKVLLMILVLSLVSSALKSSGMGLLKSGVSHWVVSIIVSVLSIRFLTVDMIQTIIMPYSTIGVAMTAALPFIIYFFFVEKTWGSPASPVFRKIAWIFFAVVFLSIWVMRQDEFQDKNGIVSVIYPVTAMLAIAMCFIDGTIQKIIIGWKKEGHRTGHNAKVIYDMGKLQNELTDTYNRSTAPGAFAPYTGGSLKNILDSKYSPSTGGQSGREAWLKDISAINKYIEDLR